MAFSAPDFKKIYDYSGKEFLQNEFKEYEIQENVTVDNQKFDISIKLNIEKYKEVLGKKKKKKIEENKELRDELEKKALEAAEKCSLFRIKIYSSVLDKMLREIKEGKSPALISFHLNKDNILHILPFKDRIQVLYGIHFEQKTDISLAKIFLQELVEAKRHVQNCIDATLYFETDTIPKEVINVDQPKKYSNGLVLFNLYTKDYNTVSKKLNYFVTFREYIQFHIHSIKTFLHIRMNKKGKELMNKLNACKIIPDEYLRSLETSSFYANWNKKEQNMNVFLNESQKLKV